MMAYQMLTENYFWPLIYQKIVVSGLTICFFVEPIASPTGNYHLSLYPHSLHSYSPFAHGLRLNYFQDAVECHHELLVMLAEDTAVASNYSDYLHFSSIAETSFHQGDHLYCLFIWHLHVAFPRIVFDFGLVFVVTASIILCLLMIGLDSLIAFCYQISKKAISSYFNYFLSVILRLRYQFLNQVLSVSMTSWSNLLAPHFKFSFYGRRKSYQLPQFL